MTKTATIGNKRNNDYYVNSNKLTPSSHKKSVKFAIKNEIIKNGTIAKITFNKKGAKGGYETQKQSFKKLLECDLSKKGLKIKKCEYVFNEDPLNFETIKFQVVSK